MLLLFHFVYEKAEAQNSSIVCAQSPWWGVANQDFRLYDFKAFAMFFLVLVLPVTWLLWPRVRPYSVTHAHDRSEPSYASQRPERRLLPEEHASRQMTQRGSNSTLGLLAPEPTHQHLTLPSLVPGTLSPVLCELRTLLRAHEFLADSGCIHGTTISLLVS